MQALVRVGLGLLLTLAPALCCCQARWLFAGAAVASVAPVESAPRPAPACPHCCNTEAPPTPDAPALKPSSPHCMVCDGQGVAVTADPQPNPQPPSFTGELLPAFRATVVPVPPAFSPGQFPSEWAGVDARSAALFDRHVMHC